MSHHWAVPVAPVHLHFGLEGTAFLRHRGGGRNEQHITGGVAPSFLHMLLASSRMVIKKGDPINTREYVLNHKAVLAEMCSVARACKFTDVLPFGLPTESMPAPCQHQSPAGLHDKKGIMKAIRAKFLASVFCQDVWTLAGEATADRRAFFVVCSYENYVAADVLSTDGTFRLWRPFDLCKMRSDVAAALCDRTRKQLDIFLWLLSV